MTHTQRIALHLPAQVYRPEFLRRTVEFLRRVVRMLAAPNYHYDRTYTGQQARGLLESPRFRYDCKDRSWEKCLAALVIKPGSTLVRFAVNLQLPDDIDRRAFQRRIEALFDQLEIEHEAARPDSDAVTRLAHELIECPRGFATTVCSDAGHVPAFGG